MSIKKEVPQLISWLLFLIAGIFFEYIAIRIIGYSAFFTSTFEPLFLFVKYSPTLAYSLLGVVTIGVPLAIIFYVLIKILGGILGRTHLVLLALPLLVTVLQGLDGRLTSEGLFNFIVFTVTQYLPVIAIFVFLYRRGKMKADI